MVRQLDNIVAAIKEKRIIAVLFSFFTAKGISFLAPFVLAYVIDIEQYGEIEFYYSYGRIVGVCLLMGISAAYPYYILKKHDFYKVKIIGLYSFLILGLLFVSEILFFTGIISPSFFYVALLSYVSALMILMSSIMRTHEKRIIAVFIDSAYYVILLIMSLVCVFNSRFLLQTLHLLSVIFIVGCSAWNSSNYFRYAKYHFDMIPHLVSLIKFSFPLLVSSFIILWLLSSQRIFLKYLLGYEEVGIFSLYFRFAMMPFIIYQFSYIQFFKPLYISNEKKLDQYFFGLMLIVSVVSILAFSCFPIIWRVYPQISGAQYLRIYAILCCQLTIWVGTALCEGIIGRENMANRMNLLLMPQVILYPAILYLLRNKMNLFLFTCCGFFSFLGVFFVQFYLLKIKCGLYLRKTLFITCAVSIIPLGIMVFSIL